MSACGEKTKVGIGEGRQIQDIDPLFTEASTKTPENMSQTKTSYFGGGDVLDHDLCVCLRAVIPSCECCCSPFFVRL